MVADGFLAVELSVLMRVAASSVALFLSRSALATVSISSALCFSCELAMVVGSASASLRLLLTGVASSSLVLAMGGVNSEAGGARSWDSAGSLFDVVVAILASLG